MLIGEVLAFCGKSEEVTESVSPLPPFIVEFTVEVGKFFTSCLLEHRSKIDANAAGREMQRHMENRHAAIHQEPLGK